MSPRLWLFLFVANIVMAGANLWAFFDIESCGGPPPFFQLFVAAVCSFVAIVLYRRRAR